MSVKASISKPRTNNTGIVDAETPESADQLARELGIVSQTTVGSHGGTAIDVSAEVEANAAESTAVSVRQSHAVAPNAYTQNSGGGLVGEFESSDLKIAQLKIVNGSGELSQKFNQGSLLLGDQQLWMPPNLAPNAKNPSMIFVPVRVEKQFRENLSQDEVQEGLMPRTVKSRAEAEALGGPGATEWVNNQKPRFSPSAACTFLVSEPDETVLPEGVESPFGHQLDGRNWTLAIYYAGGVGYSESAKVILSSAYTLLRENGRIVLHKKLWNFQVSKKKAGNFSIFVPKLSISRELTGPDAVEFIGNIMGA